MELLHDELRVEEQVDAPGAELASQADRTDHADVLGNVVRPDPEELRDARVRMGARVASIRPVETDEHGSGRGEPGVAARRAIGPDEKAVPRGACGRPGVIAGSHCRRRVVYRRRVIEAEGQRARQAVPGYDRRSTSTALTWRIAWVMLMPRGQASVQLKIGRHSHN